MCSFLLGYRFERLPNSCALGTWTSGLVTNIGLSISECSHSENQCDERTQDWQVQKFGFSAISQAWRDSGRASSSPSLKKTKGALFARCQREGTMREACIRRLFVELCVSFSVCFVERWKFRIVLRFLSKPCVCQSPFGASDVNTYLYLPNVPKWS